MLANKKNIQIKNNGYNIPDDSGFNCSYIHNGRNNEINPVERKFLRSLLSIQWILVIVFVYFIHGDFQVLEIL